MLHLEFNWRIFDSLISYETKALIKKKLIIIIAFSWIFSTFSNSLAWSCPDTSDKKLSVSFNESDILS